MLIALLPAYFLRFAFSGTDHSSKSFTSPRYFLEFKCPDCSVLGIKEDVLDVYPIDAGTFHPLDKDLVSPPSHSLQVICHY